MKKRLFGILLSLVLMIGMMSVPGLSQTAYAETYESGSVKIWDLHPGDADEKADTPAVAEQTAHDAESETTAEPGEMITEETETTSESVETTTEQVKTTSEPETESAAEADETVYAAFDESITVDGVKVRVTADAGVFPEGATLKVEKLKGVDREEAREAVDEETGDLDIAKEHLFDITILDKEGNEIQPEGKANVSFETSEVADETLETNVYHIKDNGKAEALDVDVNGVVAQVETTGFSPYSLIFSYTDSSGTTKSINLRVGETDQIGPVLDKIGISNASQDARGGIAKAVSDAPDIVRVYEHEWAGWFLQAVAGDENEHHLTVTFKDGSEVTVKVTSHKHHWTATGDKTDALTIVCEDPQNCYYFNNVYFDDKAFTAQISAEDATYDGQPHGAEKELQQRFPTHDVTVEKDIHYVGIEDTTYADSTTAPTNAGKYKAYYQVKPQGQDDVFTVQTTYTINKADIKFDPAPEGISNLIYNGENQELYTLGTAKSKTVSDKTFPIKYWYDGDDTNKVEDQVLKGKNVGTIKVNYQAEGDANHNDTEVKTIEIKIGKRPVKVSGITASNKTYDGTNSATLNFDGAEFENILTGDKLTVSAKGAFADKNAGDNKTVNITDLTLGGADADKYTLDKTGQQGSTTANITAKTLKVKWQESAELQYTGEEQAPEAEFEFAENLSDGDGKAYTGDDVQPVITGKHKELAVWTASVNSLTGENAGNYKLDPTTSNVKMEYQIVPKKITVDWKVIEKEYDAKALEPDYEPNGIVEGEQPGKHISFTADSTELVGNQAVNAGSYKATLELTGDTAKHYEITNPKTTFTITKAPLSVYTEGWIYYGDKVESKDDINDIKYVRDKCEGFKGDDGVGVLIGDVTFTTNYKFKDNATGVGGAKYNLIAQNIEAANYDIADADGELKVYPKPVELEWTHEHAGKKEAVSGEQAFTYDGKNHVYTAAVKDASDVSVETYKGNKQRDANAETDTEKYTAKAVKLSNPNYALTDKDGKAIGTVSVDFTIAQLPVELEWTPIEFTYNGKQQAPTATATNPVSGDEGKVSVTVTGGQTNARTEAYTATANGLTGDRAGNYTLPDKKTTSFTISPRSISGASVTLDKTQLTYSGSEQSVSVTEVSLDGVKLAEADYDVSGNKGTNKGDYTVKVTGKGNYKDSATADWKIVGKAMTVEAEPVTAKYDGNEYGITVNVTDPSSGTTTKFGTKEGTYDLNESPKFKSAGTHTVYFKVSGNDEYDDYTGNATVTISKKAVTASVSAEDKTYDGKTDATVSASVKAEDLIRGDSVEITGLKGSFADANAGEDKKVSVDSSAAEVSGTGSDNYVVTIPEETTASVSKAAPDVTAPGAKTLTYNGKAQGLVNAGKAKGGEMQYALGENANVAPGEGWSTDIPTGTGVGDYYVWFKVIGDDNHNNTDPVCVTVRISEKKPEPVSKATITYDLNGGTLNGKTGIVTITEDIGTVITLPAPTRDGYIFDYWQGSKYYAGDQYTVNGDHTFKAVWKTGAGGNGKGGSSKGGTKTGDPNDLAGLIALMLAAGGALGAMGYRRRKER